jgi:RNA polymerase sigma-70 factor (ECF subfamily)
VGTPSRQDIAEAYRRHAPALYRRCLSLLRSAEDAHEVVHDAFVRYWAAGSSWRGDAVAFTVLYRIATNAAIDRLRRRRCADDDALGDEPMESTAGRVNDAIDLARLVHGLDDEDVTIAVLYHIDGYTQDDIASSLDVSRPTVGKALARVATHVQKRAARFAYPRTARRTS